MATNCGILSRSSKACWIAIQVQWNLMRGPSGTESFADWAPSVDIDEQDASRDQGRFPA